MLLCILIKLVNDRARKKVAYFVTKVGNTKKKRASFLSFLSHAIRAYKVTVVLRQEHSVVKLLPVFRITNEEGGSVSSVLTNNRRTEVVGPTLIGLLISAN